MTNATNRTKAEAAIWKRTHKDLRVNYDGVRCVLVCMPDKGTMAKPLRDFTDAELAARLPKDSSTICS